MEAELPAGATRWLAAQEHSGENIGVTDTHVIFVELKEPAPAPSSLGGIARIGPSGVWGDGT